MLIQIIQHLPPTSYHGISKKVDKLGDAIMKYDLPERLVNEISRFAKKSGIRKIILFGSRAKGTNTKRSDIDIAVYGGDFDSFYWDVKENANSLLMFDIVNADEKISQELREEIEKDGVILYEKT